MTAILKIPKPPNQKGFTLLEILVVIAIFAVISTVSFTVLTRYLDVSEGLASQIDRLQRFQRTFNLLERDVRYAINRPVRNDSEQLESAFVVNNPAGFPGEVLRLTTSYPELSAGDDLQLFRVAWQLDNGDLYRNSWVTLDSIGEPEYSRILLLKEIEEFAIEQFQWSDQFGLQLKNDTQNNNLPSGVGITVTAEGGASYSRIFDLANSL